MPIKTKRWNDPIEPDDGHRLLICRFRPRGVAKAAETWDAWEPNLGPSKEVLAAFRTDTASPVGWNHYRRLYLAEMRKQTERIKALAARVRAGETITLLCSSSCSRESRCHRSLLAELIQSAVGDERGR